MGFNIGLSGIRAAASDLNITGNNIANAGTVGFKLSRAEFSDVYAASILGSGSNAQGSGVLLGDVAQIFTQGNVNFTENSLDLAINGNGFFVTSKNGALSYTRAGYFGTDRQGFITNNFGERLQGFGVNEVTGQINQGVRTDLRVDTRSATPQATTAVESTLNLNSTSLRPVVWQQAYDSQRNVFAAQSANTARDNLIADRVAAGDDPNSPEVLADAQAVYDTVFDNYQMTVEQQNIATAAAAGTFDLTNSATYNSSTSVNIYDSQGNPHVLTKYFVKTGGNSWDMHAYIGNQRVQVNGQDTGQLRFSQTGALLTEQPLTISNWSPRDAAGQPTGAIGSAPGTSTSFTLNLSGSTQYASSFAVTAVTQDGFTTGELAGLEIDSAGLLVARYTNGQTKVQGQLVLATFANQQGLTPLGKTSWAQSFASGEPVIGAPTTGTLGTVQSGALEQSNVDLSEQLINLIVAQRNYQANAKTIQTEDAVTQTIINLR
ncbi:flagellar hook protein FlgE [Pseudomonas sp.]|uniref:flagellar hook protein FlgE n=1 Tax=Pseudomonas sp. TaxID=306 RepID=UPI00272A0B66|nr:flagellar hook protein FlgE [Pseudomonas sp.]